MATVGSDNLSLAGFSGAVVDENGQTLLSTDTTGSQARIVGQSLQRELTDGVANGDFAIPPLNAETAIDADGNELPYWTWAGATGITASIAAETTWSANGNALLISVGTSATAGSFGTLTRYVPISNSGNRNYCYDLELFVFGATGAAADKSRQQITASWQAVDKDYAALTISSSGVLVVGSTPTEQTLSTEVKVPDAKAAYLLVTLKFEVTPAAVSATTTYRIGEVRLNRGQPSYTLSSLEVPSSSPWTISNDAEAFYISRSSTANLHISASADPTADFYDLSLLASDSAGNGTITLDAGDTVYLNSGTTVDVTAPSGLYVTTDGTTLGAVYAGDIIDTTGDLQLIAGDGDVILRHGTGAGTTPRLLFRDGAGTYYGGIRMGTSNNFAFLNGTSTTDYANVLAERFYPMDGAAAGRYIFDNGTQTAFSGPILSGAITSTGNVSANQYTADSITTTTATTNAAIWVLTAGTTYNLRRNSSSARYKTNIVDADETVLEAARKIKPRHYESTIADEAGATRLGFIAEEVEAAGLTHAVGYDAEGRVETLDPIALIAALFVRVNDLEARLAELESR